MPGTIWSAPPLGSLTATDGPSVTAAALTDGSPTAAPIILEADTLAVGTTLRLYAFGNLNSTSATPTFTAGFYYGGTAGVALAVTGTNAISASETLWPWEMQWEGTCRSVGSSGSVVGFGRFYNPTSLTAGSWLVMPTTAALKTVTIDTTARKQLSAGFTLSVTTGTPTIIVQHFSAELLG